MITAMPPPTPLFSPNIAISNANLCARGREYRHLKGGRMS